MKLYVPYGDPEVIKLLPLILVERMLLPKGPSQSAAAVSKSGLVDAARLPSIHRLYVIEASLNQVVLYKDLTTVSHHC